MMRMLPWLRSMYSALLPWWTRWCDGVLSTSSAAAELPDRLGVDPVLVEQVDAAGGLDQLPGRKPSRAEHARGHEGAERVGHRLPQRGREVVALARVVHDVDGPQPAALVHEPVVPVVDEVPAEDGARRWRARRCRGRAPVARATAGSRSVLVAQVVVPATTPPATAVTPAGPTQLAGDATGLAAALPVGVGRPRRLGRDRPSARRSAGRIASAAVVTAAAPTAVSTSARPSLPRPGVTGFSTLAMTIGASRLPTPIARLASVSSRS